MWGKKTGYHLKNRKKKKEKARYNTRDMYTGRNNFNAKIGKTFYKKKWEPGMAKVKRKKFTSTANITVSNK